MNFVDLFVFVSMPKCGKSTLGKMLADKLKLRFFETSDLIGEEIDSLERKSNAIFGKVDEEIVRQKRLLTCGQNCDNDFVRKIVTSRLLGYSDGTVLCGYPREEEQANQFVHFVDEINARRRIMVIVPKIPDEEILQRMKKARSAEEMEMNIPEIVEQRFEVIKQHFGRVISILGRNRINVVKVNSLGKPEEVFENMFKMIVKP